jgi:hypothetical protein
MHTCIHTCMHRCIISSHLVPTMEHRLATLSRNNDGALTTLSAAKCRLDHHECSQSAPSVSVLAIVVLMRHAVRDMICNSLGSHTMCNYGEADEKAADGTLYGW